MECPTCERELNTQRGMRQHHTKVHDKPLPNRECKRCGQSFYDPKSRLKYCADCEPNDGSENGNYSGARETGTCRTCGGEFSYYPSNKDGVYCSVCVAAADGLLPDNPAALADRVTVHCAHCGSTLRRHPSRIKAASYGSFCNTDCYGSWLSDTIVGESHHQWEGGTIPYGSSWWSVRRAALERDNHRCQLCGDGTADLGREPDVHHVVPVRAFDEPADAHRLDNVVCLCRPCHRLVEVGKLSAPTEA